MKASALKARLKRQYLTAAALAAAVLLLSVIPIVLIACSDKGTGSFTPPITYSLDVVCADDMRTAVIYEEILYTNNSGAFMDKLMLHLYPNAFRKNGVNEKFIKNGNYGKIDILSVTIDGINCAFDVNGEILTVYTQLNAQSSVLIGIECELTLPDGEMRLGISDSAVNLSGFYPVMCAYDGGWRTDAYTAIGDPFMSECADYYMTISLPEEYVVACPGEYECYDRADGIAHYEIYAQNIRDLALAASKDFKTANVSVAAGGNNVEAEYFYLDDPDPSRTLTAAADALRVFSETFAPYPHPRYTVVQSPLNAGGMEYGALCVISDGLSSAELCEVAIHETAHQWWYGIVGSDQLNDAWLDEGLTEFSTGYYHKLTGNDGKYGAYMSIINAGYSSFKEVQTMAGGSMNMSKPLYDFTGEGEYVALTYMRGALMFDSILTLMGEEKLNAALRDYCAANAYGFADKHDLIASLEKHCPDIGAVVESWVSGAAA